MVSTPQLSEQIRDHIVTELRIAAQGVTDYSSEPEIALYYYSAEFGGVQRALNIDTDITGLFLLHLVLQGSHSQLTGRLGRQIEETDNPVRITDELFESLGQALNELADRIRDVAPFDDVLARLARISYGSTGNGFYLHETGRLTYQD